MNIRESIINILKNNKETWVSGEDISNQFGISRAAVAKYITSLRKEGYLIESASRRGYQLKIMPDRIDIGTIKSGLKTQIIGTNEWFLLEETLSTNQDAILMANQNMPEGSVVIAKKQTKGRGRKGKQWFSSPRGIFLSVILRPNAISMEQLQLFSNIATLAIQKTLLTLSNIQSTIKMPNDVLIGGKKFAGVLVESGFIAEEIDWVVIGIGCNINDDPSEFPEEIRENITSLFAECQSIIPRNLFYQHLIKWMDYYYCSMIQK